MPNPKKRHSKSKVGRRRANQGISDFRMDVCKKCSGPKSPHVVCKQCGV